MRKYGKWLFRRNTSCSTGDGDGDDVSEVSIPGDGEGGEVTVDIEESLKKNVDQNNIIQESCLTPWGQKFGWKVE